MKQKEVNPDETRTRKRGIILKTGAIVSIIISVTSAILITQVPPWSNSFIVMILNTILGALEFLVFFLQLRQKDPNKQNHTQQ